jgi:hypothetical protein
MNNSIGILDINQAIPKGPLSQILMAIGIAGRIESSCADYIARTCQRLSTLGHQNPISKPKRKDIGG